MISMEVFMDIFALRRQGFSLRYIVGCRLARLSVGSVGVGPTQPIDSYRLTSQK